MSSVYDLLLKPVVTEKSTLLQEQGKYVFEVLPIANKITIKGWGKECIITELCQLKQR